jgi:hypothetical protein
VSSGLPFVPLSVESLRRPGAPELGVALCRGKTSLGQSGLYTLTWVSGLVPLRGLSCPSAEVV